MENNFVSTREMVEYITDKRDLFQQMLLKEAVNVRGD